MRGWIVVSKVDKKGLTLTELLISAAILVFALSGLLILFVHGLFLNRTNRDRSQATMHAQYILEDIRDENFFNLENEINDGVWSWNTSAAWEAYCDDPDNNLTALPQETVVTSVSQVGNPLGVRVQVNWVSSRGRAMTTQLETLFTDY